MGFNERLKCPGLEETLAVFPLEVSCPGCGDPVEIWSDEKRRRCSACGRMVYRPGGEADGELAPCSRETKPGAATFSSTLQGLAMELGATGAAMIPSSLIRVEDSLAQLCLPPRCSSYGLSPTCPPHVAGPDGFRQMLTDHELALVVKIELPGEIMRSAARREVYLLLHHVVAEVERQALRLGARSARAFAGGSCKMIFCREYSECGLLGREAACRNPDSARPSLSGFGVDTKAMLADAGWGRRKKAEAQKGRFEDLAVGLVLVD